jgi:ATP phosphoribosyltransferase
VSAAPPLRVALPKGRMLDDSLALWERIGSVVPPATLRSRRLILPSHDGRFEFLPVKAQDVATYVEAGVADLGVVGWDVLAEQGPDVLHPLDLGFGRCRVVIAGPAGSAYPHPDGGVTPRLATKYPETARRFFHERGVQVELIRIAGSVEIAPLLGLSHWILDLVESGRTLAENRLVVLDHVCESSARLIVNRASHKLRLDEHQALLRDLEAVLEADTHLPELPEACLPR